jgi:hypothetical protein
MIFLEKNRHRKYEAMGYGSMAIYRFGDRFFWITVEPVFVENQGQVGYIEGGFVALFTPEMNPADDLAERFVPYRGEFVKDDDGKHTKIFLTQVEARDAALSEIRKRLR